MLQEKHDGRISDLIAKIISVYFVVPVDFFSCKNINSSGTEQKACHEIPNDYIKHEILNA